VPWREIVTETIAVVDRSPAANVPALRRAETRARQFPDARASLAATPIAIPCRPPPARRVARVDGVGVGAHPLCSREPGCAEREASREPACFCDKALMTATRSKRNRSRFNWAPYSGCRLTKEARHLPQTG
jgi:hypothetical protein